MAFIHLQNRISNRHPCDKNGTLDESKQAKEWKEKPSLRRRHWAYYVRGGIGFISWICKLISWFKYLNCWIGSYFVSIILPSFNAIHFTLETTEFMCTKGQKYSSCKCSFDKFVLTLSWLQSFRNKYDYRKNCFFTDIWSCGVAVFKELTRFAHFKKFGTSDRF